MTPASNARIYANTNKVRGTNIMSGDITAGVFEIISKTHNSTYNNDATEWELEFDWTVNNAGTAAIDYEMQLVIIDRSTHVLGNIGTVYTADASGQTDEASETVTVPTGGSGGNFDAYLQAVEDGTSKVLGRSDTFAITLIDATVTSSDVDFDMPAYRRTDVVVSNLVGNSTINYTITYRLEKYDGTTTVTYTTGGATDLLANLVGTQTNMWSAVNDLYHRRKVQIDLVYEGYTYTSAWSTNFCYPPTTNITTFATSLQDADIKFSDFKITVDSIAYTGTNTTWWIQVDAILPGGSATAIVAGSPTNLNSWVASKTSTFTAFAPYSSGQEITLIRRNMYPSNWLVGEVPLTAKAGFDVDNWTPTSGGSGPIFYPTVTATSFTLAAQSSPWIGFNCFFQSVTGTHLPGTFDFSVTVETVIAGSISTEPAQIVNMDPQSSPGTLAYAYARSNNAPVKYLIDSVITRLNGDIYHTNGVDGTPIFLPPSFTSFAMSATDITDDGYNIKLTAFNGFTGFVGSMTNSYEIELVIKDGGGTLHTETVTWTPSTDTLPHTLFSPNRTTHSSWFDGDAQTHAIDANLFYNFNYDSGPGLVASKSQTDIVTGVAIPPAYTSSTYSIGNQTNLKFDIQIATFSAQTGYTYLIDLDIKRSGVSKKTLTNIHFNNTSPTFPYVLYSADRVDQDVDWWSGVTTDHTFTVDVTVKAHPQYVGAYTYATNSTAATTATIKPALIWRFKDNNTSLADRDGHGLNWTVNAGGVSWDSNKLYTTTNAVKLRLPNTLNAVSNVLHTLGLTMDIRLHAKGKYVTTAASPSVWSFNNYTTQQTSLSFMSHQFYYPNTTMQAYRDNSLGTPFMLNRNVSTWGKSDFETLHNWTAQIQKEVEPDGNTTHEYVMSRDGTSYDSGSTLSGSGEHPLYYPTVADNDTAARSDFNIQHVGSHLHSIVIEPIGSIP